MLQEVECAIVLWKSLGLSHWNCTPSWDWM